MLKTCCKVKFSVGNDSSGVREMLSCHQLVAGGAELGLVYRRWWWARPAGTVSLRLGGRKGFNLPVPRFCLVTCGDAAISPR